MGSMELIGAIYSQVQTNFNGLVQLAEAETNFQREVYKRLKNVEERFNEMAVMLDKIYAASTASNIVEEPVEIAAITTKTKTTKK